MHSKRPNFLKHCPCYWWNCWNDKVAGNVEETGWWWCLNRLVSHLCAETGPGGAIICGQIKRQQIGKVCEWTWAGESSTAAVWRDPGLLYPPVSDSHYRPTLPASVWYIDPSVQPLAGSFIVCWQTVGNNMANMLNCRCWYHLYFYILYDLKPCCGLQRWWILLNCSYNSV